MAGCSLACVLLKCRPCSIGGGAGAAARGQSFPVDSREGPIGREPHFRSRAAVRTLCHGACGVQMVLMKCCEQKMKSGGRLVTLHMSGTITGRRAFGPYVADLGAELLWRDAELIHVPRKTFQVLSLL